MAQHFSRTADTWLRLALLLMLAGTLGSAGFLFLRARSQQANDVADTPAQPVAFSHKHHVAQLGIDCRYCHTSVEIAADAGLPGTHVCMSCHSQIWTNSPLLAPVRDSLALNRSIVWKRVARVPDYVYFRHDIHVAKGVACTECHGRIDRMALTYRSVAFTMGWCLDCHREPTARLRPAAAVTDADWSAAVPGANPLPAGGQRMLVASYHIRPARDLVHCAVCHR